jgi:hypothetical protein
MKIWNMGLIILYQHQNLHITHTHTHTHIRTQHTKGCNLERFDEDRPQDNKWFQFHLHLLNNAKYQ